MAHFIHAIVTPIETADSITEAWPELPRYDRGNGFVIFPIDGSLIDEKIAPAKTPTATGDEFVLLTDPFLRVLESLSKDGTLAYVETEYFGGVGGQGAVVCCNGAVVLAPTFRESGVINEALKRIGVSRESGVDEFSAIGFAEVRSNEDLLERIATQIRST